MNEIALWLGFNQISGMAADEALVSARVWRSFDSVADAKRAGISLRQPGRMRLPVWIVAATGFVGGALAPESVTAALPCLPIADFMCCCPKTSTPNCRLCRRAWKCRKIASLRLSLMHIQWRFCVKICTRATSDLCGFDTAGNVGALALPVCNLPPRPAAPVVLCF